MIIAVNKVIVNLSGETADVGLGQADVLAAVARGRHLILFTEKGLVLHTTRGKTVAIPLDEIMKLAAKIDEGFVSPVTGPWEPKSVEEIRAMGIDLITGN